VVSGAIAVGEKVLSGMSFLDRGHATKKVIKEKRRPGNKRNSQTHRQKDKRNYQISRKIQRSGEVFATTVF